MKIKYFKNTHDSVVDIEQQDYYKPLKTSVDVAKTSQISKNFLNASSHLGHKSLKFTPAWHPLMSNFLYGTRNKTSILNNQYTLKKMLKAFYMLSYTLKSKGHVLIINTNPEYIKLFENMRLVLIKNLQQINVSFCVQKWVGGTLTNWSQISKSVRTFAQFAERFDKFLSINNIYFPRYTKMKKCFQGFIYIKNNSLHMGFQKKPDVIFLINPNENRHIIDEAKILNIPVIAITDSSTDLSGISYPIPANNNSIFFVYLCLNWIFQLANIAKKLS